MKTILESASFCFTVVNKKTGNKKVNVHFEPPIKEGYKFHARIHWEGKTYSWHSNSNPSKSIALFLLDKVINPKPKPE